ALASAISGTVRAETDVVSEVAGQVASSDDAAFSMDYFTDALLRPEELRVRSGSEAVRREVALILSRSLAQNEMSDADQAYLVRVISQRAGISEGEARKAAATFSLWMFATLLLGAFVASFSATIG